MKTEFRKLKVFDDLVDPELWLCHRDGWRDPRYSCFINPHMRDMFDGVTEREFEIHDMTYGGIYTHKSIGHQRWSFHESWFLPVTSDILPEELFEI